MAKAPPVKTEAHSGVEELSLTPASPSESFDVAEAAQAPEAPPPEVEAEALPPKFPLDIFLQMRRVEYPAFLRGVMKTYGEFERTEADWDALLTRVTNA